MTKRKAYGAEKAEIREDVLRFFLEGMNVSQTSRAANCSNAFAYRYIRSECEKADPQKIGYRSFWTGLPTFNTEVENYFWRNVLKAKINPEST